MPRMTMFRSACLALLLLGAVAGWLRPFAWGQDRLPVVDVTLGELMREPGRYVGREVRFLCRFAMHGSLYRREESAFSEERDLNFAVWDMHARLWDERARKGVSAALYLSRQHPQAADILAMERYQAMEVTARVVGDYARIPWVRVQDVTPVHDRDHRLDAEALTLFRRAVAAMEAGAYERAAGLLTQAHAGELPRTYREEIRSRLDQCLAQLGAEPLGETASEAAPASSTIQPGSVPPSTSAARAPGTASPAKTTSALSAPQTPRPDPATDPMQGISPANPTHETALRVTMADVRAARAMVLQKNYVGAAHAYGRAIAPGSPLAGAAWLRKEIGQLYESRYDARAERSDLEIAFREYSKADEIAAGMDAEAQGLLARALLKRAAYDPTLYAAAEAHAETVLKLQPEATATRLVLAEILAATGRIDEARGILRAYPVADAAMPPAGWMVRGRIAEAGGDMAAARAAYARVTELQPASRVGWERLAAAAEAANEDAAAADAYAKLIAMRPGHLPYRLAMGRILLRIGEDAQAAAQLQFAMAAEGETGREARALLAAHAARDAQTLGDGGAEAFSAMQAPEGMSGTKSVPVTSIRMQTNARHGNAEERHLPPATMKMENTPQPPSLHGVDGVDHPTSPPAVPGAQSTRAAHDPAGARGISAPTGGSGARGTTTMHPDAAPTGTPTPASTRNLVAGSAGGPSPAGGIPADDLPDWAR